MGTGPQENEHGDVFANASKEFTLPLEVDEMGDTRKVIVNGEEFEVELEQDGENWTATVAGEVFEIKVPDAGPAPNKEEHPVESLRNQERLVLTSQVRLSQWKFQ